MNIEFSVVLPVFNEQENLKQLQDRISKVMGIISCEYEIIYVDDSSNDSSLEILKELKECYPKTKVISFEKRRGQSAALFAGFMESRGEWIITLDADLQNPPEEIFKLLKFKDRFDFMIGIRIDRKDDILKKISSSVARFFRWLVLKDVTIDSGCALRLFRRDIIRILPPIKNFHYFVPYLAKEEGFLVKQVEVGHSPRKFGKSKYGVLKRMLQGVCDIAWIWWLKKRRLNYKIKA